MDFIIGYEFQKFGYTLDEFRKEFINVSNILDTAEERIIKDDPSHLIAFIENQEILGWAIWHESSTTEHGEGDPRDEEDRKILEKLVSGKKDFIELHEFWLKKENRGKGYGNQFFEFFEKFLYDKGYKTIIYYADDPAAIALCRQRGYKEEFNEELKWVTFCKIIEISY
ncbi:MAG: GNAT family N-acetyltransferase [Promethearchaeota archaeon]|jgi:GNAT superfamily N-acetyltransferase